MNKNVENIISIFQEINKIPRCSKHEDKIAAWLVEWAKSHSFEYKRDNNNNVLITICASKGFEDRQSIALQGHMDMVCEKSKDSKHNFSKDAIELIYDGDWIKAKDTTLGADDGIALSVGLALALDKNIKHPKLELLFTSDEETGLNGASNLSNDFFESKLLINIDSEDADTITIGCAGGEDASVSLNIIRTFVNRDHHFLKISISGLYGGHSGIDINKNRANAIKLMTFLLNKLKNKFNIKLYEINGGSARNAIPVQCESIVAFKNSDKERIKLFIKEFQETTKRNYSNEKSLNISCTECKKEDMQVFDDSSFDKLLGLLVELPHGVYKMSENGIVETSNNLAIVETKESKVVIYTNQRSLIMDELGKITQKIENIARKYSAKCLKGNTYPSWQPDFNSKLLKKSIEIYKSLFATRPKIEVIHAGLECGIIGSKMGNLEMISIGPTIYDPHTVNERVSIQSIEKVWLFLTKIIESGL